MKEKNTDRKGRNSFFVMAATLVSRLLGVLRIRVFSSVFGAGSTADAINFSFNIPNNFRKLFSEGALSSAIVPKFSMLGQSDEKEEFQKLFSSVLAVQIIIAAACLVFSFAFASPLVRLISGFGDPDSTRIAVSLLPVFTVFLVFILLNAYFSSVLQSLGYFILQAFVPILFSVSVIFFLEFATGIAGYYSMGIGAAAGALLEALLTGIRAASLKIKIRPDFRFRSSYFRDVMRKWGTALASSAVLIVSTQISYSFATYMGSGAVSAFSNSLVFWQTPYGIFFTAVSTVFYPEIAAKEGIARTSVFAESMKRLFTYLVPSAIFLFAFRKEVVAVILMTGKFSMENVILTSDVLGVFLVGMLFCSWYSMLLKLCYCTDSQRTALFTSVTVALLDFLIILLFRKRGPEVLAFSNWISQGIGIIILWFAVVSKKLTGFDYPDFVRSLLKVTAGCILLLVYCTVIRKLGLSYWISGSCLASILKFCLVGAGAVGCVLIGYGVLKIRLF